MRWTVPSRSTRPSRRRCGAAYLAVLVWDREAIQRLVHLLDSGANAGAGEYTVSWAAAVAMGDSAGALRWRKRIEASSQAFLPVPLVRAGRIAAGRSRWANARARREGNTAQGRAAAQLGEFAVAFAEGRLIDFGQGFPGGSSAWGFAGAMRQAVVEPQYRLQALAMLPQADTARWLPLRECSAEVCGQARATPADASGHPATRAFAALDPPPIPPDQWEPLEFRVCPLLLETLLKEGATGAAHRNSTPSTP